TFQVTRPRKPTPVAFFTPGPVRWKLSTFERSLTVMTAGVGPASDVIFVPPAFRNEIERPGPTLPFTSSGVGVVTAPTVKLTCMSVGGASPWEVYVPSTD